jgi:general secretion pathway protein M
MAKFINIKLARRERNLIVFCVLFVAVALILQLLVLPWFDERDRRIKGIASREKNIQEMILLQSEFMAARKNTRGLAEQLALRPKNFALFSYLEKAAGKTKVKEFITYMKPSASSSKGPLKESLVEMKLENVQLEQLSNYIKQIESPEDVVYLKRVSIQVSKKKKGTLDAVLQVLTYENDASEKGGPEKGSPLK